MRAEILRMDNVYKAVDGANALDGFCMNVFKGEILGLLSWSAAEKESLVNVLNGKDGIDNGRLYFYDAPVEGGRYVQPAAGRVFVVDGKNRLCRNITVAENIFIIRDQCKQYFIKNKVILRQTEELFKRFGLDVDPGKDACELEPLERCMVELVKAFAIRRKSSKLIILNEPSNYLNIREIQQINEIIRAIKDAGNSVVYIDNDLDLLMSTAERIMVMRDGKNARTFRRESFDKDRIMTVLLGGYAPVGTEDEPLARVRDSDEVIRFERVTSRRIKALSIMVKRGEIVSFLDPLGRAEDDIVNLLTGAAAPTSGEIYFKGETFKPQKTDFFKEGIGLMQEGALETSVFRRWSVLENLAFMSINKYSGRMMGIRRFYKSIIQEYYLKFGENIFAKSLRKADAVTMYKTLYYRWHLFAPKLLICVRPFAGLDLALRRLVTDMIREIADKGVAVIIVSSSINEAHALGDRVALLSEAYRARLPETE
ncbi:MAG: hypothetical protein LBG71_06930 [Clostridiales Family XIII bacterium]|jgi:ribose transport system ATP-binding protein|nr:hypothetical protein [Clostridiales Family XIII bacterium]